MTDLPNLPSPGPILAPYVRNLVRIGAGVILGALAAHGAAVPPGVAEPVIEWLAGGLAVLAIAGVDALWLRARKLGRPT